jgi:hypothetical protein
MVGCSLLSLLAGLLWPSRLVLSHPQIFTLGSRILMAVISHPTLVTLLAPWKSHQRTKIRSGKSNLPLVAVYFYISPKPRRLPPELPTIVKNEAYAWQYYRDGETIYEIATPYSELQLFLGRLAVLSSISNTSNKFWRFERP